MIHQSSGWQVHVRRTYMSMCWVLSLTHMDTNTCLQPSAGQADGWKSSQCGQQARRSAHQPSFSGSQGMVLQLRQSVIMVTHSWPTSARTSLTPSTSGSSSPQPLPTKAAANGAVERQHQNLQNSLRLSLIQMGEVHKDQWLKALPWTLLGRRVAFQPQLDASSALMVFGKSVQVPGELLTRQESLSQRNKQSPCLLSSISWQIDQQSKCLEITLRRTSNTLITTTSTTT